MQDWKILSMNALWDLLNNPKNDDLIVRPKFPTRIWGDITTKEATTDKISIERGVEILKNEGFKARKRIDYNLNKKYNNTTKNFYLIEYKNK